MLANPVASTLHPDHDRVAGTIETVIYRPGLGMLCDIRGPFMLKSIYCRASAIVVVAALSMFAIGGWVPAAAQDVKAPDHEAIVASPDRSDADRQTDQRRQPARTLAFTGVSRG
jgi:hypothetical protein